MRVFLCSRLQFINRKFWCNGSDTAIASIMARDEEAKLSTTAGTKECSAEPHPRSVLHLNSSGHRALVTQITLKPTEKINIANTS